MERLASPAFVPAGNQREAVTDGYGNAPHVHGGFLVVSRKDRGGRTTKEGSVDRPIAPACGLLQFRGRKFKTKVDAFGRGLGQFLSLCDSSGKDKGSEYQCFHSDQT